MSWIEKLCEVYDSAVERAAEPPLLPVGFVMKQIRFNVTLSADGRFVKAEELDVERQNCMVPSTPEAEGRTGTKGMPFPLADCLKYLLTDGKDENPKFEKYLAQLTAWCACEHAPDCLRALRAYLEKRTLYTDLLSFPGLNVKYRKAEGEAEGKGADERSFLCFSVEAGDGEDRLWMRRDVRESWARYLAERPGQKRELCYVTGEWLPVMENHPKLSGNAKLISGEDAGFPFRYKGRFIQDRSAAAVSMIASVKAHNALKWLMERQGFRRYGMSLVGWNTGAAEPLQMAAARRADSFEPYLLALRDAVQGDGKTVILGMQAATDGRMSIVCEQELPGNELAARLENWYAACRWSWPGRARADMAGNMRGRNRRRSGAGCHAGWHRGKSRDTADAGNADPPDELCSPRRTAPVRLCYARVSCGRSAAALQERGGRLAGAGLGAMRGDGLCDASQTENGRRKSRDVDAAA